MKGAGSPPGQPVFGNQELKLFTLATTVLLKPFRLSERRDLHVNNIVTFSTGYPPTHSLFKDNPTGQPMGILSLFTTD